MRVVSLDGDGEGPVPEQLEEIFDRSGLHGGGDGHRAASISCWRSSSRALHGLAGDAAERDDRHVAAFSGSAPRRPSSKQPFNSAIAVLVLPMRK